MFGSSIHWIHHLTILICPIPFHACSSVKSAIPKTDHLVEALGRRHGCLDRQAADVLPSLLQERDQVVDGQHDVGDELILSHANVADGDTHAENLLQLELDGGLDIGDLGREILVVGDWSWEFTSCRNVST